MGLLSSKKKTYTNTTVSRLVADEDIVPSNKMAVLDYTMSQSSSSVRVNAMSITDYILQATTNNVVARARKAQRYSMKDDYAYGPTESTMIEAEGVDIKGAIKEVLDSMYPEGTVVHDAYFGPMNNFYFLKPILQQKYGYNYDTNELVEESRKIGFPCYMESAQIIYSKYTDTALIDPDTLMQYGESAEAGATPFRPYDRNKAQVPWVRNGTADMDIARVKVVYSEHGTKKLYTFDINFLEYESSSKPPSTGLDDSDTGNINPDIEAPWQQPTLDGADYYQASYTYKQNGVDHKATFLYAYGSGMNTKLDTLFARGDSFGSFVPRIYARLGGKKLNTDDQKETPEFKSQTGLCRQMGLNWSSWVDEVHNSVGSLEHVTQIYLSYGLAANTNDQLILRYNYEYFEHLYNRIPNVRPNTNFGDLNRTYLSEGAKKGQTFEIKDKKYTQRVSFDSIGYMDISGSIGPVGTTQMARDSQLVRVGRPGSTAIFRPMSTVTSHMYRKQLTATVYREYTVYGLSIAEVVRGGNTSIAAGDDEELLIPLDMSVAKSFSMRERELLYSKAMHIVLNTLQVVKTKWYQTGIFKAIMFIVAVVVSYFFPPAGVAMWSWMAAVYAVVQTVIIGLVIQVAVKLLVKLGVDVGSAAAIIAVIAMLYGGYVGFTKTVGVGGMNGIQLLNVSSQAFSASSQGFALQTQKAIKEFNSMMVDLNEEQKELTEKARDLGMGNHGPLMLLEPPIDIGVRIGESPDDYFERSVHITNLAGTVYSLADMQYDLSLELPTAYSMLNKLQEQNDDLPILRI